MGRDRARGCARPPLSMVLLRVGFATDFKSSPRVPMSTPASSPGHVPPPSARAVVAEGPITSAGPIDASRYVFQFSSKLVLCGVEVGEFVNDVKCRKWTDLDGNQANTPCLLAHEPPQPDKGSLVTIGDVTLAIGPSAPPPRTIVCPDFRFEGTQTHGAEGGLTVFLFTGEGNRAGRRERHRRRQGP